ncbi:MAG: YbhB/YbcL family Raf kinase inhibitor-like protein [Myxococcales bacterium]|nr:YbhB/YbcL family Raf kinase inhibitor-like protein [Myxococcales bacterium]
MWLLSSAFEENQTIDRRFTADGLDESPPLTIHDVPKAAKSLVLCMSDPDAPRGTWIHWVRVDIPPTTTKLAAAQPRTVFPGDGSCQLRNDFGWVGYGGPAPPRGQTHRYEFKLVALDRVLNVDPKVSCQAVSQLMTGCILATATLTAIYGRV